MHPKYNRPITILLVDDSFLDLAILSEMLSAQHYTVQRTRSAAAALRMIEASVPDLIMLDINMPEMNGYDLCLRLKVHPTTMAIPIIFVSASDDGIDKQKAFNAGGADYIEKPFQPEEVDVRIQNQLKICWSAAALTQKNIDLEVMLNQLRYQQLKVMEAERVSTLSQIVGHLVQEIHAPIQVVEAHTQHIQRCCENMLGLLHLYMELCKQPEFLLSEAQRTSQLGLIKSDIADIMQLLSLTMTEANQASTVANSIHSLFNLEEADLKMVDVNQAIEVVLSILRRRFESGGSHPIRLVKQLGVLPRVTCYPNQLSQALFVMFSQALDAIHGSLQQSNRLRAEPTIEVLTQLQHQDKISIVIRHSGAPPPDLTFLTADPPEWLLWQSNQVLDLGNRQQELKVFISYQVIVDKHGGQFDYRMAKDHMAEFWIELPVLQPTSVAN